MTAKPGKRRTGPALSRRVSGWARHVVLLVLGTGSSADPPAMEQTQAGGGTQRRADRSIDGVASLDTGRAMRNDVRMRVRTNLVLPPELVKRVDRVAGRRG